MKTPSTVAIAALGASALLAAGCGTSYKAKASSSKAAAAATPYSSGAGNSSGASSAPASGGGTAVSVKHAGKLGAVLAAGPKKMTVYLFEADKGGASACSGECATAWPPVTTSGTPMAAGGAVSADLGTLKRPDGTMQVTYKGHPLYYFVKDKDAGDVYGEGVVGFGAGWYAISPKGSKVDNT